MKSLASFLLLFAISASATADEIAVLLPDQPKSYLVTVDASGGVAVSPLKSMVRPGPTPPTPTPTPTPPPGPLNPRAALLAAAAEKSLDPNRVETAQGLSMILRELAKAAPTAKDPAAIQAALTMGLNGVLGHQNAQAAWKPFTDTLAAQWAAVAVKGGSVAEYGSLLTDAADGCDASIPKGSKQIDPAFWTFLLQLLQLILPLLIPK